MMKLKFSRNVCFCHPASRQVADFYRNVFGLEIADEQGDAFEIKADPFRLFIDKAEAREWIFELVTDDLEAARDKLVEAGCRVIKWEGRGKCNYLRDPYGTLFNLWEEK